MVLLIPTGDDAEENDTVYLYWSGVEGYGVVYLYWIRCSRNRTVDLYWGRSSKIWCRRYLRGGFKKFEEKCCQIVSFHGKFTISIHDVHKHIVNICTKFE